MARLEIVSRNPLNLVEAQLIIEGANNSYCRLGGTSQEDSRTSRKFDQRFLGDMNCADFEKTERQRAGRRYHPQVFKVKKVSPAENRCKGCEFNLLRKIGGDRVDAAHRKCVDSESRSC